MPRFRIAASTAVLALTLAACGGGSDAVSTVTVSATTTEATTATTTSTVTTTVTVAPDLVTRRFQLPSRNIGCVLEPDFLRCDIRSGLAPDPTEECEGDWVGLELGVTEAAEPNCASDTIWGFDVMPTLSYGSTWSRAGIVCESSKEGLVCTNGEGHELKLARGSWSVS